MYAFETLGIEVDSRVAVVHLDRPPVNAMNKQMRLDLTEAFSMLNDDSAVRAIVLTGRGKAFCAGADLGDRPDPSVPGAYTIHNRTTRECFQAILECRKPTIAAINGPAIGAGCVIMCCCDILVAQENAWISMPEVEVGLAGGPSHVMRHFGASDARLMMFTARRISAPELLRMNAISASVPADELQATAAGIATEIASKSPAAVTAAKASFLLGEDLTVHSGYRYEQTRTEELAKGPDFAEAQAAFREKRKPRFE